ncbi:MAG: helix-turn-helix domain-containing protein [Acidisphaera sp.]|nr:helix-turn-helix domain-containing protein [Acidisphaera sp.]
MTTSAEPDLIEAPLGAPRIGAELRSVRERLGWSLDDVEASLRIRYPYLLAIEDGRTADLPGGTYTIGFVRAYAALLGLDQDEVARRFRAEAGDVNRRTELEFPAPVAERGVPTGAVVLLGAVLAAGAYVAWYRMSGEQPGQTVQQVPDRLAPLAETASPAPASPMPPQAAPAPPVVAPEPAVPSVPPSSAAAAIPPPPPALRAASPAAIATAPPMPAAVPGPTPPAATGASSPVPGPDQGRIVLRAHADAWVQVRDPAGKVLLNRVLHSGEAWPVPAGPQPVLTTGNAGGLDLLVDGSVAPSIGANGAVRRDLPLDPDMIKDGKLQAQIANAKAPPRPAQSAATPSPQPPSPPLPTGQAAAAPQ